MNELAEVEISLNNIGDILILGHEGSSIIEVWQFQHKEKLGGSCQALLLDKKDITKLINELQKLI